jgi:hypothetical protein
MDIGKCLINIYGCHAGRGKKFLRGRCGHALPPSRAEAAIGIDKTAISAIATGSSHTVE